MSLQTKILQNMKKCSSERDKYPNQQPEYKTIKYKEHLKKWRMSKQKKTIVCESFQIFIEDLNLNFMWL